MNLEEPKILSFTNCLESPITQANYVGRVAQCLWQRLISRALSAIGLPIKRNSLWADNEVGTLALLDYGEGGYDDGG